MNEDMKRAARIKDAHEAEIMGIDGVIGVGIDISETTQRPRIRAYVKHNLAEVERRLPKQIEGIEVATEDVGDVAAF